MSKSRIEWTEHSWNPLRVKGGRFGCTKVSPGCLNCYAGRMNKRFGGRDYDYKFSDWQFYLDEKVLTEPLRRKKPTTYFVCSICDLFHEAVPDRLQDGVWSMMAKCPQHTFQILTKRPKRMAWFVDQVGVFNYGVLPNVWLGTSAENQEMADLRIQPLLQTPAAKHFVSVEPMLSGIDLNRAIQSKYPTYGSTIPDIYKDEADFDRRRHDLLIDWVVAGCESGPGARPADPDWLRSLRDQCVAANIPFFLKQMMIDGKLVKMPTLDGVVWEQRP